MVRGLVVALSGGTAVTAGLDSRDALRALSTGEIKDQTTGVSRPLTDDERVDMYARLIQDAFNIAGAVAGLRAGLKAGGPAPPGETGGPPPSEQTPPPGAPAPEPPAPQPKPAVQSAATQQAPAPATQPPVKQKNLLPEGATTDYGRVNIPDRVGDGLEGHEVWEQAYLRQVGVVGKRRSRYNAAIMLTEQQHDLISALQSKARLHDPDYLRTLTARELLKKNAEIMLQVGVPVRQVNAVVDYALEQLPALLAKGVKYTGK